MTSYAIRIENCNSIDIANIEVVKGVLNIKYGPNGIGKSTISKALVASVEGDGSIAALKPFKYRAFVDQHAPRVSGAEEIKSILVFDDSYVSQFAFQRDEVLKNSFDIFINTEAYQSAMREIDTLFDGIKSAFNSNDDLNVAISDLKGVRDAFSITKAGAISKASKGYKAYGSGNKLENIPPALQPFEDFLKIEQPASWIAWQSKGCEFLDMSENCPYCASSLREPEKKEMARLVSKEYDSKSIEHLNSLQLIIARLGKYFEAACRLTLEKITKAKI